MTSASENMLSSSTSLYVDWCTSNAGIMSRSTAVIIPKVPKDTAAARNSSVSRCSVRIDPSAVMRSMLRKAAGKACSAFPLPWVAVAIAPAIVTWGSDATCGKAAPLGWRYRQSCEIVVPPPHRTVIALASISSIIERNAVEIRALEPSAGGFADPGHGRIAAQSLNECPDPTIAISSAPATTSCNSVMSAGEVRGTAPVPSSPSPRRRTFPDQFVRSCSYPGPTITGSSPSLVCPIPP
mmetsp:Transcript_6905/g.17771  ORF Transcript_6905/g.17771 Transcript_6905/m.17771 type:complete len:239 (-) Transcript_6905:449-1165(-)